MLYPIELRVLSKPNIQQFKKGDNNQSRFKNQEQKMP
jgi:hypothetical protein